MAKKTIRYGQRPQPDQPTMRQAANPPASGTHDKAPQMSISGAQPVAANAEAGSKTPNVTPQQQSSYDQFVNNCYRILFEAKSFQATLQMINAHNNPVQGLGTTLTLVALQVQEGYRKQNKPLADAQVVLHGSLEVMTTLAQVCAAAKIHTFTPQELGQIAQVAIPQYIQQATKAGLISPQQVKQDNASYSAPPVFRRVLKPGDLPKQMQGGFAQGGASPNGAPVPSAGVPAGAATPQGLLSQGS